MLIIVAKCLKQLLGAEKSELAIKPAKQSKVMQKYNESHLVCYKKNSPKVVEKGLN